MVFDPEPFGCQRCKIGWAGMYVKHLLALIALKVMMMPVIAELKSRIFTWQHDLTQCAILDHGFEIPINRRDTKAGHSLPSKV
jgi:hypothetical protein